MTTVPGACPQALPETAAADVHVKGDEVTIALAGDIDGYAGAPILDLVDASVPDGVTHVVLDMSRVGFLDLGGLRVLLSAHRLSAARGARMTLRHPAAHVRWLLHLTDTAAVLLDDPAEQIPDPSGGASGDPPTAPGHVAAPAPHQHVLTPADPS